MKILFAAILFLFVQTGEVINLHTMLDVAQRRIELNRLIFGDALPDAPTVENDIADARLQPAGACSIDRLTVTMEYGFDSAIYHLRACDPNGRLVIVHDGHSAESFSWQMPYFAQLLTAGYDVAAMEMPLYAENHQIVEVCHIGCLKVRNHNMLSFVRPTEGHALRFHLEPVIAFLNYTSPDYRQIDMIGLSGGGWATTWAAALDDRITNSYPVAGSIPLFARNLRDWGDWEQWAPEIYRQVSYSELYVLGSTGSNRQQMQILNLQDACCFASNGWNYAPQVEAAARALGGRWSLLVDDTHEEHQVSPFAFERILESMNTMQSVLFPIIMVP